MRFLLPALLCLIPLHAAVEYVIYADEQCPESRIKGYADKIRAIEANRALKLTPLNRKPSDMLQAKRAAKALEDGAAELPALVLRDEKGAFAHIPIDEISAERLQAAKALQYAPGREAEAQLRLYLAHQYLLFAELALEPSDSPERINALLQRCRRLMGHELSTPEDRQRLGLLCLYPLLMKQYASGYHGCHTPDTEAKLLEAIEALEQARDINPESPLGRKAYAERERLRQARRKSRLYE